MIFASLASSSITLVQAAPAKAELPCGVWLTNYQSPFGRAYFCGGENKYVHVAYAIFPGEKTVITAGWIRGYKAVPNTPVKLEFVAPADAPLAIELDFIGGGIMAGKDHRAIDSWAEATCPRCVNAEKEGQQEAKAPEGVPTSSTAASNSDTTDFRWTFTTGKDQTVVTPGFYVDGTENTNEWGLVYGGSINKTQVPAYRYFMPGTYPAMELASGEIVVGRPDLVAQRAGEQPAGMWDISGLSEMTLDEQTLAHQVKDVRDAWVGRYAGDKRLASIEWGKAHDLELARAQALGLTVVRTLTGDGAKLSFRKGDRVTGAYVRLNSGKAYTSCSFVEAPEDGEVTSGVLAPFPGEMGPGCSQPISQTVAPAATTAAVQPVPAPTATPTPTGKPVRYTGHNTNDKVEFDRGEAVFGAYIELTGGSNRKIGQCWFSSAPEKGFVMGGVAGRMPSPDEIKRDNLVPC
jgi:hypothetical protein